MTDNPSIISHIHRHERFRPRGRLLRQGAADFVRDHDGHKIEAAFWDETMAG